MNVHKVILSAESAQYLPFALGKLRLLAEKPYCVSQTYRFGDVTCYIRHDPAGQQFVRLEGGAGLRYEFFTSDAISFVGGYGTPPYVSGYDGSYVCGHSTMVTASRNGMHPSAMSSWTELNGAAFLHPTTTLAGSIPRWIGRSSYNNQKVAFHQQYTTYTSDTTNKEMVWYTSTPAAGQSILPHKPELTPSTGAVINPAQLGGDVGWDVRMPVYKGSKKRAALQPLLNPPYWWRRGTVIMAKDGEGKSHPITVSTDAMSNFYFYRTVLGDEYTVGTDQYVERYVPPESFQKVPASSFLPAWVSTPTVETMHPYAQEPLYLYGYPPGSTAFQFSFPTQPPLPYNSATWMPGGDSWAGSQDIDNVVQTNEYLWVFNSDGTAASAIVHEDKGPLEYRMPSADEDPANPEPARPIKVMRWGYGDLWIPEKTETEKEGYFSDHGKLFEPRAYIRGLISVDIAVTITGEGPMDFTASVTLSREIKNRYYLDVAYAMSHAKLEVKGVNKDDLLVSELELYTPETSQYEIQKVRYSMFLTKNLANGPDSNPLLTWRMDAYKTSDISVTKLSCLDFGNLTKVTPFGGGDPVPPYGMFTNETDTSIEYHFNSFFYDEAALPLESYTGSWTENTVMAADLKALAFIVAGQGYNRDYSAQLALYMFGDKIKESGLPPSAGVTSFPPLDSMRKIPMLPTREELDAADKTALEPFMFFSMYGMGHRFSVASQSTHLLNVHPNGHYSAYTQTWGEDFKMSPPPVIDVIAYAHTDSAGNVTYNETTHMDMFNEAFGQSRSYGDYAYGAVFGVGMFATAGMWV